MTDLEFDPAYPIFHAVAFARQIAAMNARTRFAYYTTAETAAKVLRNRELWLRMPTCMNDASEVQHGREVVLDLWGEADSTRLMSLLDELHPGLSQELTDKLDADSAPELMAQTFIACLSEHAVKPEEDRYGRLSMWRAYGGVSGVAIVVKGDAFWSTESDVNVYVSPVEYLDKAAFTRYFNDLIDRLEANRTAISGLSREQTLSWLYQAITLAMLCVKHPAFHEEQEWRIFYSLRDPSPLLPIQIETIRGIAQPVIKLPLSDAPGQPPSGRSLADVVERVIIGPTEFPLATASAFAHLLTELGVPDAGSKVIISGIPLRQTA